MADVAGIVIQLSLLLFEVGGRIQRAIEQHKSLAKELGRYKDEIDETRCIIDLVETESALQEAPAVYAAIKSLHILTQILDSQLEPMTKSRGTVKGVSHQLVYGAAEQQVLKKTMERLARGKQRLGLQIQLVHVGLSREARDAVAINTKVVQHIDAAVQRALGPGHPLAIAALVRAKLKEQRPDPAGFIKVKVDEYNAFNWEEALKSPLEPPNTEVPNQKQRIITNSFASGDALQLNAPIEKDLWVDMDVVKIDGCVASERAIQTNYIQSQQTLRDLLASRNASIAHSAQSQGY